MTFSNGFRAFSAILAISAFSAISASVSLNSSDLCRSASRILLISSPSHQRHWCFQASRPLEVGSCRKLPFSFVSYVIMSYGYALSCHKTHWISSFLHQCVPNVRSQIVTDPKSLISTRLALPVSGSHDTELRASRWESRNAKQMLMPEDCRVVRIIFARMIPESTLQRQSDRILTGV